jgi:hypothetical protein
MMPFSGAIWALLAETLKNRTLRFLQLRILTTSSNGGDVSISRRIDRMAQRETLPPHLSIHSVIDNSAAAAAAAAAAAGGVVSLYCIRVSEDGGVQSSVLAGAGGGGARGGG